MVYESAEYRNAVFVGFDGHAPKYAACAAHGRI